MTDRPPLPASCSVCVYYSAQGACLRHAPAPGQDEFDIVHWPRVRPTDRCGVGAAITDGTGPGPVPCQGCFHWLQPGGQAVVPDYKKGLPDKWWEGAGLCTRFAPSPSTDEDRKVYWRVTNAMDGCGDGAAVLGQ